MTIITDKGELEQWVLRHLHNGRRVEWECWQCGARGAGFMPEEHASGACVRMAPTMLQGVALEAQKTVMSILHGTTHFTDGGGI